MFATYPLHQYFLTSFLLFHLLFQSGDNIVFALESFAAVLKTANEGKNPDK